jgi:hypothetical protein
MVSLTTKTMNETDLLHCGQQHIGVLSRRYNKRYRPHIDAAIEALGSLPVDAPFGCAQGKLYPPQRHFIAYC